MGVWAQEKNRKTNGQDPLPGNPAQPGISPPEKSQRPRYLPQLVNRMRSILRRIARKCARCHDAAPEYWLRPRRTSKEQRQTVRRVKAY
jgi:hypothetical protein